jgi:uncharacterized repeat protein (TIGR01451 family)
VSGGGSSEASGSDGGGASGLADLSISKSANAAIVPNGATVTYTLELQNAGPSAAQAVTVSDPLDSASYSDITAEATQGSCDTVVSCSLGTLAANASATITITATVSAKNTALTNTASVMGATPDPNPLNNSASATITVPGTADLAIEKTGTVSPEQGGADSFTLSASNEGPDSAEGVVVNDTLPRQFTATEASGGGFACTLPTGPGGTVVCKLAALAPTGGSPVEIMINGTLAGGTAGQTTADAATVSSNTSDPEPENNTATFSQLVGPAADLTITKKAFLSNGETPVTNPLSVGENFIYALRLTNNGPSAATGTIVTDTLPSGITLESPVPLGCTPSAPGSSGTITCAIGALPAGETVTIDLTVHVGASAANTAPQNTAMVSSETPDPNPRGTESSTTTVGVGEVAALALTKSVSPPSANIGEVVTYTFVVTNNIPIGEPGGELGKLGTTGAVVTDTLPAGVQFVSSTSGSSCSNSPGPPETITCAMGAVAQGEQVTGSFTARVTPAAAGEILVNTASVASVAAGGFPALPDIEPADNVDHASLRVSPVADLSLTKAASDSNPGVDDEVDYTLTATNTGPDEATGVMISDPLPAGLDFIDASPGCDNENGTVTCKVGSIASAGNASVTVRTRTTAALAGTTVENRASVTGEQLDPDLASNEASSTIDVKPLVDLRLTKVASNPTPTAGGSITYTLSLLNNGPSPATGVTITDPFPNGLTFESASAGQGSCSASAQTVQCQLGTIAAGGGTIVTITADVALTAAGSTLGNTATASANEPIARPDLLSSTASIKPAPGLPTSPPAEADLAIAKTVNHLSAHVGGSLTYTVTVTNHGPATASSPTVTDIFSGPVKVVSVSTPDGSCTSGSTIVCKLGSIANGASETITTLARPTVAGQLRNSASVASTTPDPNAANNVAHATANVGPGPAALRLTKTASRRTVGPGQAFSFTIAVRSLGPEPALAVKVCDRLGSEMTFVSVHGASFHDGSPCWKISSLAKGA